MDAFASFRELCRQRRSIRAFSDTPVSREDVTAILEVAQLAPSISNIQPWRFSVVYDPAVRAQLREAYCYGDFLEGGSVLIVVCCDPRHLPKEIPLWNPRELEFSCVAAMENVLLAAQAKGLAGCWVSLHRGSAHKILGLDHECPVVGGLIIGHPAEDEPHTERERKPLSSVLTILG